MLVSFNFFPSKARALKSPQTIATTDSSFAQTDFGTRETCQNCRHKRPSFLGAPPQLTHTHTPERVHYNNSRALGCRKGYCPCRRCCFFKIFFCEHDCRFKSLSRIKRASVLELIWLLLFLSPSLSPPSHPLKPGARHKVNELPGSSTFSLFRVSSLNMRDLYLL